MDGAGHQGLAGNGLMFGIIPLWLAEGWVEGDVWTLPLWLTRARLITSLWKVVSSGVSQGPSQRSCQPAHLPIKSHTEWAA